MTKEQLTRYFYWLDRIRETNRINMYAAVNPLASAFDLTWDAANTVFDLWADTFDPEITMDDRVNTAMKRT